MWEGAKSWASLIVGIVVLSIGAIPMSYDLGISGWTLPKIPEIILLIVLAIAAFYLAIDGFMELLINPGIGYASIALGCIVGTASILKALQMFNVILNYFQSTLLNIVFFIVGSLLIIGAFMF
jgi:hypothetical protein